MTWIPAEIVAKMESRPNATEAAGRLLALRCVVSYALAAPPRDLLTEWLGGWNESKREQYARESEARRKDFWDPVSSSPIAMYFSPWERRFAATTMLTMSAREQLEALWRVEAAQVLMWALGLVPQFSPPETQAELINLPVFSPAARYLDDAVLRSEAEINRAREVAELWHWRANTEQLVRDGHPFPSDEALTRQGLRSFRDVIRLAAKSAHERGDLRVVIAGDFGIGGKPYAELSAERRSEVGSISLERHRALNWLCGYSPNNDWDKTPTDT